MWRGSEQQMIKVSQWTEGDMNVLDSEASGVSKSFCMWRLCEEGGVSTPLVLCQYRTVNKELWGCHQLVSKMGSLKRTRRSWLCFFTAWLIWHEQTWAPGLIVFLAHSVGKSLPIILCPDMPSPPWSPHGNHNLTIIVASVNVPTTKPSQSLRCWNSKPSVK